MSKKKGPSIPDAPSFQTDPNVGWSQDVLKGQVPNLLSLTNLPPALMEAIQFNPELQQLAVQQYTSAQEPAYRRGLQDITNTLEANNQLTGSTTGNTLQNYQNDYLAGLTSANAGMAINQINNALSNRIGLYTTGLNTAQAVGKTGLDNQNQQNTFALQNYENQVASALMSQPQQTGGFLGGLQGAVGGAIGGFTLSGGNPIGALAGAGIGGFSGFSGSTSSGGNYLNSGLNILANKNSITSSGAGAKNEQIFNNLAETPSYYRQGLSYGSL